MACGAGTLCLFCRCLQIILAPNLQCVIYILEAECVSVSSQIIKSYLSKRPKSRSLSVVVAPLLLVLLAPSVCVGHEQDDDHGTVAGLDPALFMAGAVLASSIEDCTLSDGTRTMCHSITIAGFPVNHDIGPFCPPTTSANAEEGGIFPRPPSSLEA